MTEADTPRPIDALRDYRDELCWNLSEDIDIRSMIWDAHGELDNQLAEYNHAAVMEGVEHVIAALRSVDLDVIALAQLAAIHLPGDSDAIRTDADESHIPEQGAVADPAKVKRQSTDEGWTENQIEDMYEDDVRAAFESATEDHARYVRRLVDYAADLVGEIIQKAQAGNEKSVNRLLAQRDDLTERLSGAAKAWELALAAQIEAGGAGGEFVELVYQWLDEIRGQN